MPARHSMLSIRPGRASDLEGLCVLENTAFSGDRLSRRRLLHWLGADNGTLLVAEEAGEVLGYGLAIYRRDSRAGRVYSLAVDPAARGRRVGMALMAALEADAGSRGCGEMRLEVASRNAPAVALYQRLGYIIFGRRPGYYESGDSALRMHKPLGKGRGMQ